MKKLFAVMTTFTAAATLMSPHASARDNGPGSPGGGKFSCYVCKISGGWIPGPYTFTECFLTENGDYGECKIDPSDGIGCIMSGGCVSLPDDVISRGLRP